jgi:Phosphotransferase enzyme family
MLTHRPNRWNEEARLRERHHVFNVSELCRLVAIACGRPESDVTAFEKLAEGGWNRSFKATLRGGCEVIARLPFPCSLPKRYSTLSEVATMTFLREQGLPVPKIHDWSATVENSVGSEYMIMEKVHGTDLRNTWYSMTMSQRLKAVSKIVQLEKALFDISLPACGSIYLKDTLPARTRTVDIQSDMSNKVSSKFCIGPSAEFLWWHSRRAELGAKIGPCKYLCLLSSASKSS